MLMHERGRLKTWEGMVVSNNKNTEIYMNNPVVILDKDTGTLIKMGDSLTSGIKNYYDKMISKYRDSGMISMCDSMVYLEFDRYNGILNIDDICTLINYMNNSIGAEKMNKLLSLDEGSLKLEVQRLQDIGF